MEDRHGRHGNLEDDFFAGFDDLFGDDFGGDVHMEFGASEGMSITMPLMQSLSIENPRP